MKKTIIPSFAIILTSISPMHKQVGSLSKSTINYLSNYQRTTNINLLICCYTPNDLICYISIMKADSASLAKMILAPDFSNGLKNAMIGTQQGLTLGDMKAGKWNGYNCYNVDRANAPNRLKVSFTSLLSGENLCTQGNDA